MKNIFLSFIAFIFSLFAPRTNVVSGLGNALASPNPTSISLATPTASPTPKPLTFEEMSSLYGPCTYLPTLMYHHIQSEESAKLNKQTNLSVYTDIFKQQMQYLKTKGYSVLGAKDLVAFFTNQTKIPPKSVLITFDDGYSDFYTDAYPILRDLGFKSIVFVPTGLVNNPGYLSWDQISEMKNNNILFANHTWSHKNVLVADNIMKNEIETADTQLKERELNEPKVFAYPYGIDNAKAENYLSTLGYNFAFTTKHGSVLCNKQKFDLPRIRIGNKPLNGYGF